MATPLLKDVSGVARIDPQFLPPTPRGSWYSILTQPIPVAPATTAITFSAASPNTSSYQVSPVGAAPFSVFRVSTAGVYSVTLQLNQRGAGITDNLPFTAWLRVNGTDVAWSGASTAPLDNANADDQIESFCQTWLIDLAAGDTVQPLMSFGQNPAQQLEVAGGLGFCPDTPSARITFLKISNL